MTLPATMNAMVLEKQGRSLEYRTIPLPSFSEDQVLVKVFACGVCRTDLHVVDGDLKQPKLPIIPGHEIIGKIAKTGNKVTRFKEGDLVGIPWMAYTCDKCKYCLKNQENLCENALFTGYTIDGGYAEYTVAYQHYCFPLPASFIDFSKAPLLCAGLIGYRSYRMTSDATTIGIYGFGAAAHILTQVANKQGKKIYAFTRDGDAESQQFALKIGAVWAGDSSQTCPVKLDAAIIFAPVGNLIPKSLMDVDKGGIVVCGGIHMSDIPSFPYHILWEERVLRSVANLTKNDAEEFLTLIKDISIKTEVEFFHLKDANQALENLRDGKLKGATVLII